MEPGELLAQGMEFARTGDRDRARELIAKAVKADPSLKQGWWALVHLLEAKNQRIDCLKQVLKLDPSSEQARAKLAELQGAPQASTAAPQDPSRAHSQISTPPARSVASSPPQVQTQAPVKRGLIPPGIKASLNRKYIYAAAAVVGVIMAGVLITLLFTRWILPAISDRSRDDLANLPVPTLPLEWITEPQIMVLVPTGSLTPTATQVRPQSSPTVTKTGPPSPTPRPLYTSTITPTFDPRSVATATRASPETCPAAASPGSLRLTDPNDSLYASADEVLAYLNAGGSVAEIRRALGELPFYTELLSVDLTHDGLSEVVMYSFAVYVFHCHEGHYEEILRVQPAALDLAGGNITITTRDLNHNGIQDILLTTRTEGMHNSSLNVLVYEWDGEAFASLIAEEVHHPYFALGYIVFTPGFDISTYNGDMELEDVDRNGTVEIILDGGVIGGYVGNYWSAPQRSEIQTWMWNGEEFNFYDVSFSKATLKIHVVQEGDLSSRLSKYEQALDLYWRAINDPSLEAWNAARLDWTSLGIGPGTPEPTYPPPDQDQAKRVEAYARFRIIVTNLLLERTAEAEAQYQLIHTLHPAGDPGYPYAQMATAFYDAYQDDGSIGIGCAAARAFADQNQADTTAYLGWMVYGEANMNYGEEDICPFY